jgi:hypothetical protein
MRPESPQIARPDVWTPRLALPYESAYSLLEKYMWLNCASGHDVSRNLLGMHNLPPAGEKTHDLLFGKWIQFKKCNFPLGMPLREGLLRSHKSQWPQLLANGSHFDFVLRAWHLAFTHFIINLTALAIARFTLNRSLQFVSNAAPEQGRLHCVAHSVINHFRALLAASR